MESSRARGSRTSRSSAKPPRKADSRTTTPSRDERVDAKFTFVVHGGEVLAIFRAIRDLEGKWQKETPYIDGSGRAVLNCYARVGQHGTCCPEILWKCRRAKPEEYLPLKRELEEIAGYNVGVVQHGKLRLKEETGYAACWMDEYDSNEFGVYKVFRNRGAALDYLTDMVFERAKLLEVDVVDQNAQPVIDDNGDRWFPKMTWQQVRDQLGSGMDFGLVLKADWEYGYLIVKEQACMGIREVTIGFVRVPQKSDLL